MTKPRRRANSLGWDAAAIGWAAPQVIALRLMKLSLGGPAAAREAERMVSEKLRAGLKIGEATQRAARSGDMAGLARETLDALHRPVMANRKRLSAELRRKGTTRG